uniref:E3 ubiquitin-protein ligase RNF13 n=1 Tax=Chinchilla lanigera TaxID=34839 RepID=A0A8C2W684_CHILA
ILLSIVMLTLSATQVYTILTVQLFAFSNLLPVGADTLAYNFEKASHTFDYLPAKFGYRPPAEGLKGFLINSKPENACEPIMPLPVKDNSSGIFILLIRRLDCNFHIKVLNAQREGYKAAIVHNVHSEDLIHMGSNDTDVLKNIDIPSVFIGESSGNSLKDEFTHEKGVGICLILVVIFMMTKFVQDRHRARRNRLGKDQLKKRPKLPVHKFKKGDEYDVCAICLDEHEDGDKLRILPCSLAYHCKCVDLWLTKTKKTCPVCKQKAVPSQGDSDSDTDSSQEENEVSQHTPLLRPLASVSAQSSGALSESHSHQNMTDSSDSEDNEDADSSEAENEVNEHSVVVQLQPNGEWDCDIANTV